MLDLDPGEYGLYIWTAYGLSAAGMAWLAGSHSTFSVASNTFSNSLLRLRAPQMSTSGNCGGCSPNGT